MELNIDIDSRYRMVSSEIELTEFGSSTFMRSLISSEKVIKVLKTQIDYSQAQER